MYKSLKRIRLKRIIKKDINVLRAIIYIIKQIKKKTNKCIDITFRLVTPVTKFHKILFQILIRNHRICVDTSILFSLPSLH